MLAVLRNGTYRALFSAQVIALVGTGLLTIALGLVAFDLAGASAGAVLGTALTIKMVAYVGVAPVIAALVDRLPKKAVLVGADAVRFTIASLLPLVTEAWQIYALVFVLQSASATFTPAFQALIPAVLPEPREHTSALALSRLAYDLEALLSPVLAAALLTFVDDRSLFVGTAFGFAGSAILVLIAAIPRRPEDQAPSTFWQRLPAGALVFSRTPTLRFLLLANVVVAAATAVVLVNSVVYVKSVFGLGDAALAVTLGAYGAGSLLVAVSIPRIVDRFGVTRTMLTGLVVIVLGLFAAVPVTVMAVASGIGWWALLLVWVMPGAGTSLVNTPSSRLLAAASTPGNRNLVYTAQFALSHACFLLTYPLAGWVGAASLPIATALLTGIAASGAGGAIAIRRRAHRVGQLRETATVPTNRGDRGSAEKAARSGSAQRPLTLPNRRAIGASTRGRAATHPATITSIEAAKIQNPTQLTASCAAYMWLRLRRAPVAKTRATCTMMNATKYSITGKWTLRAHSTGYALLRAVAFFGQIPLIRTPVAIASGAAMNTVAK